MAARQLAGAAREMPSWEGRGVEGNGLSVCLPLMELRIELLNKVRTCIDANSKATFIQSPWI